jgi:DNA polymerase III subunit delta'
MPFKPEKALSLLDRANQQGRLGHAYLITGPREADLNRFALDLLRLISERPRHQLEDFQKEGAYVLSPEGKSRRIIVGDQNSAAPNTMRHFIQHMQMSNGGRLKPAIIQDAERMNDSAQNAFLRTLEEPPGGALFLLLTHNPRALLPTTRSRVIEIALLPPPGARIFTEYEEQLLSVLRQLSARNTSGISGALTLKAGFQEVLEQLKTDIKKDLEDEFKKEQDHYKQTTDGSWLKQREEQIEAQIEASYHQHRDALMDLLLSWMGDVARQQIGGGELDLPPYQDATAALAKRWTPGQLQERLAALRKLDQLLRTNVNESLALEVTFITAFG